MATCLNCDRPVPESLPLFCSDLCRETAKAVRYARAVNADGRIADPEVRKAVRIKLGLIVGGGYPERARRLSREQRQAAFDADGRQCRTCGQPATEIDHIGDPVDGDVNHPSNLQALCSACHREKTLSTFRPIQDEVERSLMASLRERIRAPEPLKVCDSPDWKSRWRGIKQRRAEAAGF